MPTIANGPHRKPVYHVTRKDTQVRWYWRETLAQTTLIAGMVLMLGYAAAHAPQLSGSDAISMTWVLIYGILMAGFVAKSWFGLSVLRRFQGIALAPLRPGSLSPTLDVALGAPSAITPDSSPASTGVPRPG